MDWRTVSILIWSSRGWTMIIVELFLKNISNGNHMKQLIDREPITTDSIRRYSDDITHHQCHIEQSRMNQL